MEQGMRELCAASSNNLRERYTVQYGIDQTTYTGREGENIVG